MPLYYIGDDKKYKYNFETIHSFEFNTEMKYFFDNCNRINRNIWSVERIIKKIDKLKKVSLVKK